MSNKYPLSAEELKQREEQRPSPLTKAHITLYELQEEKGSYLTYEQAERKFRATSGLLFGPGTTFEDIFKKLEDYNMIVRDPVKKRIFVLADESDLEKEVKPKQESILAGMRSAIHFRAD